MKYLLAFIVIAMLSACATQKPKSMEEARARVDAAIRYGVMPRDAREQTIAQFSSANLPEKSSKPLNTPEIEKRAAAKAAKMGNYSRFTSMYNRGEITRSQLTAFCAKEEQIQALAEQQRKLRRAQVALAIAAGLNQATANMNAATAASYTHPTYTPTYPAYRSNPYSPNSLSNPYGAGSPYKANGLMNPYSQYGSRYSNKSWTNPYATNAPKIYSADGTYHGRLSTNKYDADSTSNPYGRYGSKYSSESLNNPYGAGNPYSGTQYYVVPQP